jgi:lipopolysaccharide/colanic/teichoic acid biosynthesis glycosyltransferase
MSAIAPLDACGHASNGRADSIRARPHSSPALVAAYFSWKGLLDRAAAAMLLVPGLPLIGVLIALVRLTSKGPGIYRQQRVGRDGRVFTMYKLRSMRIDAEAATGPAWAPPGTDPRVTRVGYWLRKLHLDELPQLVNVLRGEMSLIGPRPERPEFVEVLGRQIPGYLGRLAVAPGITGLAQINLPPDTDLDSVRRKLVLDCEYIRDATFFLDCRIFICTLLRMFGIRGGRAVRWLGLHRRVELPVRDELDRAGEHGQGELPATPGSIVAEKTLLPQAPAAEVAAAGLTGEA